MEIQNFKMRVTPEQSMIVQQTLFNNEYKKKYYGDEIYIPAEPKTFIYLNKDGNFTANNFDENYFNYNTLPELTFQEFFDRYVKWCVKVTDKNYNTLEHWCINRIDFNLSYIPIQCYVVSDRVDRSYQRWTEHAPNGYIELTFEQFEKYVLKSKESKDMEKRIIGYKLKDECKQYEESAAKICHPDCTKIIGIIGNKDDAANLEKAGVLNLWFEPVYEETSKELYFGGVKFTIKKGDNFATTEYGKVTKEEIGIAINYIENPPKLNNYTFGVKMEKGTNTYTLDIIEKSKEAYIAFGCQEGTYKELKAIYNAFE
jgi:hypothetical protein